MNNASLSSSFLDGILHRTGKFYIVFVLACAQLIVTPLGITLAAVILYFNAEFTSRQLTDLALFTGAIMIVRNILLIIFFQYTNRPLVETLGRWKKGNTAGTSSEEQEKAWKQITLLAWRYIAIAFAALMLFVMTPVLLFSHLTLDAVNEQLVYIFFAGLASGLCLAILEVLVVERMLVPARIVVLPPAYDIQMRGVVGFRLLGKYILIVVVIVLVSALLIAPIGYHQTLTALQEETRTLDTLRTFQWQSIIATALATIIALGLSLLLAQSVSRPIRHLIGIFQKFEQGELNQRIDVTATDEVGELSVHFNQMANKLESLQTGLEQVVSERTSQLRATLEVGQVASSILEPSELIARVVQLITDRFGYYYAAIFLNDSTNHWAELVDATGAAGAAMKAQGHRLEIGGVSMVGTAIARREARIALDVGQEPVRFDNPLLPQTRSEIALPLMIRDRVLGALDVQSTEEAAFDQEDINTLQGMANQVAIALENAHLFQETRKNLEELRAAHRLYITDAWSAVTRDHGQFEYTADSGVDPTGEPPVSIEVPITLREQAIGWLSLEGREDWTEEERSMIEAVATQAALALENARLLEESQQLALRERLVAEITAKIWTAPNMEQILQTAIKELGRALRADEATIELGNE